MKQHNFLPVVMIILLSAILLPFNAFTQNLKDKNYYLCPESAVSIHKSYLYDATRYLEQIKKMHVSLNMLSNDSVKPEFQVNTLEDYCKDKSDTKALIPKNYQSFKAAFRNAPGAEENEIWVGGVNEYRVPTVSLRGDYGMRFKSKQEREIQKLEKLDDR